jgi:hypothetical protein
MIPNPLQRLLDRAQHKIPDAQDAALVRLLEEVTGVVDAAHSKALPIGRASVTTILWCMVGLLKTTRKALADGDVAQLRVISNAVRNSLSG